MSVTSKDKMEPLYCGEIEIEVNDDLKISIYADGYSLYDLLKKEEGESPTDEFDKPFEWEKYTPEKIEDIIEKLNIHYNCSDLKQWINKLKRDIEIESYKENIKRILKDANPNSQKIEITLYEPPLKFEKRMENGKFVEHLKINEEKAILITLEENGKKNKPQLLFPLIFQENASYYVIINEDKQISNIFKIEVSSYGFSPRHIIIPYKGRKNGWTINFGNMLFYGGLYIFEKNTKTLKFQIPILVFPKKVSPNEAIKIVEDLLRLHSELILDYTEATGLTILPGEFSRRNPIQILKLIQTIWKKRNLGQILQNIMDNPHKVLVVNERLKNLEEVAIVSPYRLIDMTISGECLKKVATGGHIKTVNSQFQFTRAYDEEVKISHDTYPNRFVKFFLKFMINQINWCLNELKVSNDNEKYYTKFLSSLKDEGKEIRKNTLRFLSKDFFNEVSDLRHLTQPPQVLLKEERYKTIFKSYLEIIKGIITDDELEELLKDPIKNMPELYEYWCFLKMKELFREKEKDLKIKFKLEGKIKEKGKVGIKEWKVENKEFSLEYQKRISQENEKSDTYSYTVPFKPDIFLETNNRIFIFDSKYRVDFIEEWEKELDEELLKEEKRGTFKLGDLYKMHTYREAIRKKQKDEKDREGKKPLWVIALYPGDKIALFSESGEKIEGILSPECQITISLKDGNEIKLNKWEEREELKETIKAGGVGAIPFRPEFFEEKEKREILKDIFETLFSEGKNVVEGKDGEDVRK